MQTRRFFTRFLLIAAALLGCTAARSADNEVRRISIDDLRARLGQPGLVVIDVRGSFHWERSQVKIPGAVLQDPVHLEWTEDLPRDKTIVLYCS